MTENKATQPCKSLVNLRVQFRHKSPLRIQLDTPEQLVAPSSLRVEVLFGVVKVTE